MTSKSLSLNARRLDRQFSYGVSNSVGKDRDLSYKNNFLKRLNDLYSSAFISMLRFRRHYFLVDEGSMKKIVNSFLFYSNEDRNHADSLADHLIKTGGIPVFSMQEMASINSLNCSIDDTLKKMIVENLMACRSIIVSCRDLLYFIDKRESVTNLLINSILNEKEEHAEDLQEFLEGLSI